ncbi:MAG: late competence development ComFB family protein [Lachnospiraceae bacterium]|nr:late competence development ComFB family protein [Lachnospiraceae bacterium]MDE7239864.1 late competence development ComFB family protein [Lachnospiraceae bacterium]
MKTPESHMVWGSNMTGLINLMEETVLSKIDELWKNTEYCKCEQCKLDVATYALNRLPAQYVQSMKGKVLYRFESNSIQRDIEVTVAVSKGIEIVGNSPHKNANPNSNNVNSSAAG